ncbi:hypothetical protein KOR42_15610 [Thalassoglobus neptunius]|uniref:DUF2135 domain-containing protein n=1 Tax=Thalassoglobus neptunius TaxID=1938619 RepID=A0A5C5X5I5_9PLAN|nr:hypothetical protein [Thalassoglobus neptunius]TWT58190.1 hypothetical protein KOR42_15610 [Thalassoglobus neptunius]
MTLVDQSDSDRNSVESETGSTFRVPPLVQKPPRPSRLTWLERNSISLGSSAVLHIWIIAALGFLIFPVMRRPEQFAVDTTVRFESPPIAMAEETVVTASSEDAKVSTFDAVSEEDVETQVEGDLGNSTGELASTVQPVEKIAPGARSAEENSASNEGSKPDATVIGNRRTLAGGKSGEVTVSLIWNTFDDLDLHVWNANGHHVWFGHRESPDGMLDVDANIIPTTDEPIENYFEEKARPGYYRFSVDLYRWRSNKPVEFTLGVWVRGREKLYRGRVMTEMKTVGGFELEIPEDGEDDQITLVWLNDNEVRRIAISEEKKKLFREVQGVRRFRSTATRKLQEFISKYPDSLEAVEAQELLESIQKRGR